MTKYEKARAEYAAEMRNADIFNFVAGICAGVLGTLLTMVAVL
jgi:hypothetical protein